MEGRGKPQFELVAPVFWARDVARSRSYYVDQLGFELQFEWADEAGEPPRYVILRHGTTELHLSQNDQLRPATAYFFVNGVQEYYDNIKVTQARITEHIQDLSWEMREFEVEDLDGNKLIFGEHLSRRAGDANT